MAAICKRVRVLSTAACLAFMASAPVAAALPTSPSIKPAPAPSSNLLNPSDATALEEALQYADRGRWSQVAAVASRIHDETAQKLARWRQARDINSGMSIGQRQSAAGELAAWPRHGEILSAIEGQIGQSDLTANQRIDWLTEHAPRTGEGVLALADAYDSMARRNELQALITEAWGTKQLSGSAEQVILGRYGNLLSSEDHWRRVDMLLWRGRLSDAQTHLSRLSAGRRALAEARIAVRRNRRGVDNYVQAVPDEYANDPGLTHERARWRERRGRDQGQLEMLLQLRGADAAPVGRMPIWTEKHAEIRRLIREGDDQSAYQLTLDHGMTSGEGFRDAEWTAGWLALTRLNDPARAEQHFRVFGDGVSTPISVARARYWLGRALAAQRRNTEAESAFLEAAAYNYVYYGQLAAEEVSDIRPDTLLIGLPSVAAPTDAARDAFRQRPEVRAAALLAELGRLGEFERFSNALDDQLETAEEHRLLFELGQEALHMRAAIRGAKAGLGRGLLDAPSTYPILALPRSSRNGAAEDAMVLALSRQESEFHATAVSSANARGLMQMVPRYARAEARQVGLPFRESWLTDDPIYNLRLGRGFLDELVDQFDGSYVLAAAAYNAGPSRARQWIRDLGDPRSPDVDVVDWIEQIPFGETRNYVQRVLENTQVYRHRLAGEPVRTQLSRDLKRGGY